MKKREVKNYYDKYDWAIFASNYLLIAKLACQELLSNNQNKHNSSISPSSDQPYKPWHLFIPILFNIKHGIEIFIKTLSIFTHGEYEEGHDIKDLFREIKLKIKNLKLSPAKKGNDEIKNSDIEKLPEDLSRLEDLINYFYTLDLLKRKIGLHYTISDIQNDIFRYPDNKASIRLDWGPLLSSYIKEDDIKEILEKLEQVHKLFNQMAYLFSILNK